MPVSARKDRNDGGEKRPVGFPAPLQPPLHLPLWASISEIAINIDFGTNGPGLTPAEMLSKGSWTRCLLLNRGYFLGSTYIFWKSEHYSLQEAFAFMGRKGNLFPNEGLVYQLPCLDPCPHLPHRPGLGSVSRTSWLAWFSHAAPVYRVLTRFSTELLYFWFG